MPRYVPQNVATFAVLLLLAATPLSAQRALDSLKTEAEQASGGHQALLYAELTEALVDAANDEFAKNNFEQGQALVQEVLQYGTKACDQAIASRHKMKEVEIHLRLSERHLGSIKRTLPAADRPPLGEVEKKFEDLRQKLLDAMFAKPKKKPEESK